MFIHKRLSDYVKIVETKYDNILCCMLSNELFDCDKDVMFIGIYNHPANSVFYHNKDYDCTLELLQQFILSSIEVNKAIY